MMTVLLIAFVAVYGSAIVLIWVGGRLLLASVRRPRRRPPLRGRAAEAPTRVRDDFTLQA